MLFSSLNIYLISYNIFVPLGSLLYLQWINSMADYTYFFSSIICPFANLCALSSIILYYKYKNYNLCMQIDQFHLFIIGLLEFFGLLFAVISVLNISYLYTLIFGKSILVLMMFSNYIFLNRRYYKNHYIGALIICSGIFISLIPTYFNKKDNIDGKSINIGYLLLYILSLIIHVINYTFREKFIKKDDDLNVYMMNFYINFWQLLIGILFFPLIMLPIKGFGINPNDIQIYFTNAISCQFLQINNNSGSDNKCNYSLLWLFCNEILYLYILFLVFEIVKKGSSVLYSIQNILIVPTTAILSYFCFKFDIIHANKVQKFSFYPEDYISLFLIILGLAIYLYKDEYTLSFENNNDNYNLLDDIYPENSTEIISKIPFSSNPMIQTNLLKEEDKIFSRHVLPEILEESRNEKDEINILFSEDEYKI